MEERSGVFRAASVPDGYDRLLAPAMFEPWADVLVRLAGLAPGQAVLDVASGTGVVARLAARTVGPSGRVVASDASAAMLEVAARRPAGEDAAPIEHVVALAGALPFADGTFDVALCQQGLPFIADRDAAAAELRRVLRPGGVAAVSVWETGRRLEPFAAYNEALQAHGVPEPYPRAYDGASFTMSTDDVRGLLERAGFAEVDVRAADLELVWPDAETVAAGITGTPFAPVIAALPAERRAALLADITHAFGPPGAPVRRTTTAVLGRAIA
jgi:ubiquinone/menaquinone biosynthesis C-methylase UbiE